MASSEFVVFYGDGSVEETDLHNIGSLRSDNVQAIAQKNEKGWHVVSHAHFYIWDDTMGFYGADESGFWQAILEQAENIILCGRTIHTPIFQEIFQRALAYADDQRRSEEN